MRFETVKKPAALSEDRAAGELEGARPASSWINRRPKRLIYQAFRVIAFCMKQNARRKSAVKKVPIGLF